MCATVVAIAAIQPAAAVAADRFAVPPSGRTEMVFAWTNPTDAANAVSSTCMDAGWMIVSNSGNQVVCEVPMGMWQSALTQMLLGNRYSTTPRSFARFSMSQIGEHTRAQAMYWAETQMAFGQVQQHQYSDGDTHNNLSDFLAAAGAQYPVGTTFPHYAYLGIDAVERTETVRVGRRNLNGIRAAGLVPDGPAVRLGLQEGDLIVRVNNRTFRDVAGFFDRMSDARVGAPLTLVVIRGDQEMTLTGTAEGRPSIRLLVAPDERGEYASLLEAQMRRHLSEEPSSPSEVAEAPLGGDEAAPDAVADARRRLEEAQAALAAAEAASRQAEASMDEADAEEADHAAEPK